MQRVSMHIYKGCISNLNLPSQSVHTQLAAAFLTRCEGVACTCPHHSIRPFLCVGSLPHLRLSNIYPGNGLTGCVYE
jgi:hypothetical protein